MPQNGATVSDLGRLYTYAKGGADAKEDFTTEALAICLRHDPAPFIDALRTEGLLLEAVDPTTVVPYTQLSVPGVGRVDLVVRLGGAALEECWFEVKVDAPESGDQLARYAAHVSALPGDGRPQLIVLAREPIRGDGPPLLPWGTVHAAARSSATPHWQDLADWLEELRMVDTHDGPISPDELEALPQAVSLYEKLCHVLADACSRLAPRYPDFAWPRSGAIRSMVEGELSHRGRFMLKVPLLVGGNTLLYFGVEGVEPEIRPAAPGDHRRGGSGRFGRRLGPTAGHVAGAPGGASGGQPDRPSCAGHVVRRARRRTGDRWRPSAAASVGQGHLVSRSVSPPQRRSSRETRAPLPMTASYPRHVRTIRTRRCA